MKSVSNPFVISGYEGEKYFCDRRQELSQLSLEIENGNNVALIASRRMGKSGLIQHYFAQPQLQDRYYTFFIDIYDTQSLNEFVLKLSRNILTHLKPHGLTVLQRFWDCMHSLQAGISFSPMGEPSFNVQLGDIRKAETTLDEIFHYIELADRPCIVAIDEFQQIGNYPEKNIEATLRTYVQHSHNAQFIFAGSQRHTMSSIFTSASRPFFQSVSLMHLGSIDIQAYDAFAKQHFQESGRKLADGVTQAVYESSKGITWYTQKLFNTLFALTEKGETCTVDMVNDALNYVLNTQGYSYEETLFRLPEKQKMVLLALAQNGPTEHITAGSFVSKYGLPSASTVQSAIRGLLEKDFVTYEQGTYYIYDLFLWYWLRRS
ncbi:MAG: helix-turn-helix domain-containing protein [Paludibacteraceae bacterium]|nr:helix-turn-helix domain-containing protein [Paludibacteraceae bacterium]